MHIFIRNTIKWTGVAFFGFFMFITGEMKQSLTSSESITDYFVSQWVDLDEGNQAILQRYNELCNKPPEKTESFSDIMASQPLDFKSCAIKANASDLYDEIEKANHLLNLSWPLNLL